jgi:c-di-GMP-binding flagellar brake protein YcgR
MTEPEVLISDELIEVLQQAVKERGDAVMSYLSGGKWHMVKVSFNAIKNNSLSVVLSTEQQTSSSKLRVDQPVGISVEQDFNTYIFESVIAGFGSDNDKEDHSVILFNLPERLERMQRRAYQRVPIPKNLNVKTLFWHRGYIDDQDKIPSENYWQGRLIDLSAGGLQLGIDRVCEQHFSVGQLIGLKFTPMSYQKPIILEAQIRHIAETADSKRLCIGVEFLGLEASKEGREKLRRIVSVTNIYKMRNHGLIEKNTEALAVSEAHEAAEPLVPDPDVVKVAGSP